MSTVDLIQRARDRARVWPMSATSDLVTELTDEVDRLRGENERQEEFMTMQSQMDQRRIERLEDQRDAARAALERVRAATQEAHLWYTDGRELIAVRDVLNAVEGEPS